MFLLSHAEDLLFFWVKVKHVFESRNLQVSYFFPEKLVLFLISGKMCIHQSVVVVLLLWINEKLCFLNNSVATTWTLHTLDNTSWTNTGTTKVHIFSKPTFFYFEQPIFISTNDLSACKLFFFLLDQHFFWNQAVD